MESISSHAVQSLMNYLSIVGLSRDDCLDAIGVTQAELNRKNLIDIQKYENLYRFAESRLNDRSVGFNYGQHIEPSRWGVLGEIAYTSSTLEQALQSQRQYQSIVGSSGNPSFSVEKQSIILTWSPNDRYNYHIAEELLTSWVAFARRMTATHLSPERVWFFHELASDERKHQYEAYFGCPVIFSEMGRKNTIGLSMPRDVIGITCTTARPELNRTLKAYADSLMSQYSINNSVTVAKDYIASKLPNEVPSLDQLAAILSISERTLQRRLMEFDSTFKQLVDEVKCDIALHYLVNTKLSFQHISDLLNFSEQSAFSRAVKRWTGNSPVAYRQKYQTFVT